MDIRRMIVGTTVRAIVYRVVGLCFIAMIAMCNQAKAQTFVNACPSNTPRVCDQGGAFVAANDLTNMYASCRLSPYSNTGAYPLIRAAITSVGHTPGNFYTTNFNCQYFRTTDNTWQTHAQSNSMVNYYAGTCAAKPPISGGLGVPYDYSLPGSPLSVCVNGCSFALAEGQTSVSTYVIDGVTWTSVDGFTNLGGATCLPTPADEVDPVPPDADGDGVSDSLDAFPNDPTETTDSDGDGIGDNADFSPEDPTDGQDTPGEEDGDDEGDNQAGGGANCAAPPTCSGDGIQCAQLFQLWKLRCQGTAQGTVTGNPQDCSNSLTVSSPDAVANAQLLALRKIACASGGGSSGNVGDANENGVADVLEGAGTTADGGEDDDVTRFGIGINTDMLDQDNIFGSAGCPTIPSFPIMGKTISFSDFPYFCQIMAVARVVVLLMGAFAALQILMGRAS